MNTLSSHILNMVKIYLSDLTHSNSNIDKSIHWSDTGSHVSLLTYNVCLTIYSQKCRSKNIKKQYKHTSHPILLEYMVELHKGLRQLF